MYRDDEAARAGLANVLIDEIAELERQKVKQATIDQRLESAKRELATLQSPASPPVKRPGLVTHVLVFFATAGSAFAAYTLLF